TQTVLRQKSAQRDRLGLAVAPAQQRVLQFIEELQLLGRRQSRMIGYVVCSSHELVEGHDRRPVLRFEEPRRNGKILLAIRLPGTMRGRQRHRAPPALAWKRPFQLPPRPCMCSIADCTVHAMYKAAMAGIARAQSGLTP